MTKVQSVSDYPQDTRYLLIIFSVTSVFVPGDERSRTHPGHGYEEHTDIYHTPEIFAFRDREGLQSELTRLYERDRSRRDILVVDVRARIPVKASISVEF